MKPENRYKVLIEKIFFDHYKSGMKEFEFDEQGRPKNNWLCPLPPKLFKTLQQKIQEWEKDPQKKKRSEEFMQRKREEFYAKEANRKLVD